MNIKRFYFAILTFLLMSTIHTYAVKAYPYPVTITQPDGTKLTILLKGDENKNYRTTEDGYLLSQTESGEYQYATLSATGSIVMSGIKAKNSSARTTTDMTYLSKIKKAADFTVLTSPVTKVKKQVISSTSPQKAYPLNGSPKALVILANFSDKSFSVASPQISFQNLTTQSGYSANGGTGSAKDYFMASTYGKFSPNFIVVGPVTLPKTLAYYGTDSGGEGNDIYPAQMIVDACAAADAAGLDFTQFDTDGDGYVDNVFVYYAGYNQAEGAATNTIWPHRWSVSDAGITTGITFDGKKINDYSCTSELKGTSGTNMCGIGTFCHEFGHVLGLPDYYDTSGTQSNTLNEWDIMDYGAYSNNGCTPPVYSAYDRFFLGYLTPEQVSTASDLTLTPLYQGTATVSSTSQQAYLLSATTHNLNGAAPSPAEFFIVEYRKKTGWDAFLPAEGVCIWHIDFLQSQWDANTPNNYTGSSQTSSNHMRVYLQPLSGSTTTPGTAFTTGSFTPTTWSGTNINRVITAITKSGDNYTFKLMGGQVGPTLNVAGTVNAFATYTGTATTAQSLTISSVSLTDVVNVTVSPETNFDIKLSTDTEWKKSVTLTPVSGIVNGTLNVRYNPTTVGNHNATITVSSTGATSKTVQLSGTAIEPENPNAPSVRAGRIDNLLTFANTKVNSTKTKTLNIKTTDVMNTLSLVITGDNAQMFSVSASSLTKEAANNLTGTNITVQYTPTAAGSHTATLTISGGGLNPAKVITLNGIGE